MHATCSLRSVPGAHLARAARPICFALALTVVAVAAPRPAPAPPADDATIAHVLNRIGFGPAPGDVERVRGVGLARYIEGQLHPDTLPDSAVSKRLAGFATLGLSSRDIAERYYGPMLELRRDIKREQAAQTNTDKPGLEAATPQQRLASLPPEERQRALDVRRQSQRVLQELGQQKLIRAVYSERQLQEVLVDFWFNHFNVFAGKGPVQTYLTEYERDAIRPHVLGRFREMLGAVAHSPAMLFYLDNWQSSDPDMAERPALDREGMGRRADTPGSGRRGAATERALDENRRRAVRDRLAGMSVEERERAMAEIRQRMPRGLNENYARELLELHTLGVDGGYAQQDVIEVAKAFTGWTIRGPRQGGTFWFDDRRHVKGVKTLLGWPIDRGGERDGEAVLDLLAEQPATATFIATKLTRRFVADDPPPALVRRAAETFRKTHGDLRQVTRTILTSPEFLSPEARRAKVKTPFEFVASALRTSGADVTDAAPLLRHLRELGMPLYFAQPPTGYSDRTDAWVNTGALLARMNFALALVGNRIAGVRTDLGAVTGGASLDDARARFVGAFLADEASESTRRTLGRGTEITEIAALTLGSPEFQRR